MDVTTLCFIDETGFHLADYPSFLAYLQQAYRDIYGQDVYLENDSQDGQWIAIQAKALFDTASIAQSVYNSFAPVTAQGAGLSRVVKINGLARQVASFSTVTLTLVGQNGTVITNGVAADILQQQWLLPVTVTIPGSGTIDVMATAAAVGAIDADANTITTIFTPTLGWQTVNNAAAATPGAAIETDAQLRIRQSVSVAIPSQTVLVGTVGAVENVAGVTKVRSYENDTDDTDANDLPPHSICIVVAGGDDTDIANAIAVKKTPGTNPFGDTTVNVTDAKGMPLPISFQRAVPATIHVVVTIETLTGWSSDFEALIENAVAAVINAGQIGDPVQYTKLFAPAYLIGTPAGNTFDVVSIAIGKNSATPSSANISLLFDEDPVCDPLTDVVISS